MNYLTFDTLLDNTPLDTLSGLMTVTTGITFQYCQWSSMNISVNMGRAAWLLLRFPLVPIDSIVLRGVKYVSWITIAMGPGNPSDVIATPTPTLMLPDLISIGTLTVTVPYYYYVQLCHFLINTFILL
jgi:hypothetical protein